MAGLTSFLGMGMLSAVDMPSGPVEICPGDRFVLMSDGVYNARTGDELCRVLRKNAASAARCIAAGIAKKAYSQQDNYTAVILQCEGTAVKRKKK